jgi:cyclic pyranopterin phosphate synthase
MQAEIQMIDVADKAITKRSAAAECRIVARPDVRDKIIARELRKGDALATAQVAGVMAAKRVPDIIPLCHPVNTTSVTIDIRPDGDDAIVVHATVKGVDRTGFEMEALAAASIAALTIYDMAKGDDPAMRIDNLRVLSKSGGKSGEWVAE